MIDEKGQISAELILILATISMIVLITAHFTINYLKHLHFEWPVITANYINYILKIINRK